MVNPEDILLYRTCFACPEQYDAVYQGKQVGYLRLRHGMFRVDVPDVGGDTVYSARPNGDGIFEGNEREEYLWRAKAAIAAWLSDDLPRLGRLAPYVEEERML